MHHSQRMETIEVVGDGVQGIESHDAEPSTSKGNQPNDYFLPERNGFLERQAKRVARNPCTHLCTSLLLGLALSVIAIIVGEFSISANSGGWQSRGTLIADRQTQLMLVDSNQHDLLYGGDAVWDELINNVQSGWEDDDDDATDDARRRRLEQLPALGGVEDETTSSWMAPRADRLLLKKDMGARNLPFEMTPTLKRRLQDQVFPNCDMGFYSPSNLTDEAHLWPLWEVQEPATTALDPNVMYDICIAEQETQKHLEEKGLCFGCEEGCLPPYSIVLYARLIIENGVAMSCAELRDAWAPLQASVEQEWKTCVEDIKNQPSDADALPESCPEGFMPSLVEESFDETTKTLYTSSIFPTHWSDIDELYAEVESYDKGSKTVAGAYDTQWEDFANLYLDESLNRDMALAMGSAVVVSFAIVIHTRSPFLTAIGLVQIILSFPLSYFVYKLLAGLEFFPFLNFIGIFVVFALGAGDVFVAVDKWKNARLEYPKASTEYVAAVALPDAAAAMFLTTLTTAVAFFATAICPVAPVKMFAIFCGLLIVFDYIMNVLLVFPALCIYDGALFKKGGHKNVNCCIFCSCFGFIPTRDNEEDEEEDSAGDVEGGYSSDRMNKGKNHKPSLIRRILLGFYNLLHYIRWPLFVASLAAFGVTVYVASTLELPTSSDVRLLQESNQFEQNYLWRQNLLSKALEKEGGSQAFVIWGVTPADTGDQNDPGSWSQLVLDNSFDASSEESQLYLHQFCNDLFAEDFASKFDANYICPMQQFGLWLEEQTNMIAAKDIPDRIYMDHCNKATSIPMSPDHFDACIGAWARQVGETSILLRNDKVQVMFVPFVSRVRYDGHYDELDEEWHLIEEWMDKQTAPSGVRNAYFSSFDFWWYDTNGQMLSTAYSAAGIALACAAVVILFSSRSFTLTIFSTLTIGYVLTSVTATLVAMGWTLGFLESICFAILIGVSVDFVIHFSHAYSTLEGDVDRGRRTKHALIQMGPSILATAATTILSAIIMLFTVITFFQKFALILFFTVIQASVGSFVIFLVLVDCVGPSSPTYLVDNAVLLLGFGGKKKGAKGGDEEDREESERTTPITDGTPDASERTLSAAAVPLGSTQSSLPMQMEEDDELALRKVHSSKRLHKKKSKKEGTTTSSGDGDEDEDEDDDGKKHKKIHKKKSKRAEHQEDGDHDGHSDNVMPYYVSKSPPASPKRKHSHSKKKHHHHHHRHSHVDPEGFNATE